MNLRFPGRIYSSIARHVAHRFAHDLDLHLQILARNSSAAFISSHMADAIPFENREDILKRACQSALEVAGCFCEFGVFQGNSLRQIARIASERDVYGFDSFEGLPQNWRPGFAVGAFKTQIPTFREKNVKLHVGLFENVLPDFICAIDSNIAFAHIDCDIYSSTQTVLELIHPKLTTGSVLLFDEYFNYPGWEMHEHKAFKEYLDKGVINGKYMAYNKLDEQVMVVIC